jgi:hypothetical protein
MVALQPEITTLNFTAETWVTTYINRAYVFLAERALELRNITA